MVRTAAANDFEQQILDNIQQSGWHCNAVGAGESHPAFVYTVGLEQSFGRPELIIFGLAPATAHGILAKIVQRSSVDGASGLATQPHRMSLGVTWPYRNPTAQNWHCRLCGITKELTSGWIKWSGHVPTDISRGTTLRMMRSSNLSLCSAIGSGTEPSCQPTSLRRT